VDQGGRRTNTPASHTWKRATKETKEDLPIFLADLASAATILYAVTLHFLSGPLRNTSGDKLAVAVLSVVVLLRPFYRSIAEQCLKEGPAKALTLYQWRKAQWSVLRAVWQLIRDGDSAMIEESPKDDSGGGQRDELGEAPRRRASHRT
jgi:hypothetical protein